MKRPAKLFSDRLKGLELPTWPTWPAWRWAALASSVAAALAGCGVLRSPMPTDQKSPPSGTVPSDPGAVETPSAATPSTSSPNTVRARPSTAENAKAYRKDAAAHLYALNGNRIYRGRLPPMLYAIGVLDVDIDKQGRVGKLYWRRAPTQAPEVIAEIEKIVRSAAPYPVPARLGKVIYTDVWLWHESGKFQLDTLTEGQD